MSPLLLIVSCERTYEILQSEGTPELSVNVPLVSGDTLHYAYIVTSMENQVKSVGNAHLSCYVNGSLCSESDILLPASSGNEAWDDEKAVKKIPFVAKFTSGDVICLNVNADGMSVTSEVCAPKPAEILGADTVAVTAGTHSGNIRQLTGLNVRICDVSGTNNYYRVMCALKYSIYEKNLSDGNEILVREGTDEIKIDNTMEPAIRKGLESSFGDLSSGYTPNAYNLFTDELFRDKEYTLALRVPEISSLKSLGSPYVSGDSRTRLRESRTLVIRLLTMPYDAYVYYMNCSLSSGQNTFNLLPFVNYPDNVIGGNGFAVAMSSRDYEIKLADIADLFSGK